MYRFDEEVDGKKAIEEERMKMGEREERAE